MTIYSTVSALVSCPDWLRAMVTPIQNKRVSKSSSFSDYRPISVTPILSRLAEKLVVYGNGLGLHAILYQICFPISTPLS